MVYKEMKINDQIKSTPIDVRLAMLLWHTFLTVFFAILLHLQAVASKLHGQDVEVNIIKWKGEDCDHVQFEINERVKSISVLEPEKDQINFDQLMSFENKISPFTFCKAFPFHMVFDKNMILRQVSVDCKQNKWLMCAVALFLSLLHMAKHCSIVFQCTNHLLLLHTLFASFYWIGRQLGWYFNCPCASCIHRKRLLHHRRHGNDPSTYGFHFQQHSGAH